MAESLLILGGNGFIGKHLAQKGIQEGYETYILCRKLPHLIEKIMGVNYLVIDLTSPKQLEKIKNYKFNYVVNLSGNIDHSDIRNGGISVIEIHLNSLIRLISILPKDKLKGFVQIGTSDEYGNTIGPQYEDQLEKPFSPYSYAKFAATHFIKYLSRTEKFPGKVLRPFLIYGPGQKENRLVPYVIKNALKDNTFKISSGEQLRDFLYIKDAVDAIMTALKNKSIDGKIINIGSGKPTSVRNVVETIVKIIGTGKPLFGSKSIRDGESLSLYSNIKFAKDVLCWEPKYSLEDGLKEYIKFLK